MTKGVGYSFYAQEGNGLDGVTTLYYKTRIFPDGTRLRGGRIKVNGTLFSTLTYQQMCEVYSGLAKLEGEIPW